MSKSNPILKNAEARFRAKQQTECTVSAIINKSHKQLKELLNAEDKSDARRKAFFTEVLQHNKQENEMLVQFGTPKKVVAPPFAVLIPIQEPEQEAPLNDSIFESDTSSIDLSDTGLDRSNASSYATTDDDETPTKPKPKCLPEFAKNEVVIPLFPYSPVSARPSKSSK